LSFVIVEDVCSVNFSQTPELLVRQVILH